MPGPSATSSAAVESLAAPANELAGRVRHLFAAVATVLTILGMS